MKIRPILYSAPMVNAIIENIKTETRRLTGLDQVNKSPKDWEFIGEVVIEIAAKSVLKSGKLKENIPVFRFKNISTSEFKFFPCPFGKVGDIMWVRETFFAEGYWQHSGKTKTGKQKYSFYDDTKWSQNLPNHGYKYLDNIPENILKFPSQQRGYYKRNSLFMTKEACRLFLKIKSIKIERLNDISEKSAVAEGIQKTENGYLNYEKKFLIEEYTGSKSALLSFKSLWHKINGTTSWVKNTYVWVIEFEKTDRPANFLNQL